MSVYQLFIELVPPTLQVDTAQLSTYLSCYSHPSFNLFCVSSVLYYISCIGSNIPHLAVRRRSWATLF